MSWKCWKRKKEKINNPIKETTNHVESKMRVNYYEESSGRDDVKRYAATKNAQGEPQLLMTIQSWMTMVSSNSTEGIQAASDLSDIIASSSYTSLFFETPGASWTSSGQDQFQFAIVDKPMLHVSAGNNPDRDAFAENFSACSNKEDTVCSFANLGGDALLVSPLPQTFVNDSAYSHLVAFVRNAPKSQVAEFWRLSAHRYLERLGQKHKKNANDMIWFSTCGMGVSWLHLRLDSRPKYYSYGPFKSRESTAELLTAISYQT